MPHSDPAVRRARWRIRNAAAEGNKTAKTLLKQVERDEAREARHGEQITERP